MQRSEITAIFSVTPHKVGDLENASFSNIEQQARDFVNLTLMPWAQVWKKGMTNSVLAPTERKQGYFIRFDMDGLLRGGSESR